MADFLDLTEAQLIVFAQNFAVKLAVHDPVLVSVLPADVTQASTNSTELAKAINTVNNIREDAQEYTNVKETMLYAPLGTPVPTPPTATAWPAFGLGAIAGILAWYRAIANRIKADPLYTVAIGQDLGIIGPADAAPGTPVLIAEALSQSQIRLRVTRAGYNSVAIDSRRAGGNWEEIGVCETAEFIDGRQPLVVGQPEVREYRAQGRQNNARVGALSAVVNAVTVP
jgi:hypothetical protein